MIPLYSDEIFQKTKSRETLPLKCKFCNKKFNKRKKDIIDALNKTNRTSCDYCSRGCKSKSQIKLKNISCKNCNKTFKKQPNDIGKNNFCSRSCAAIYNNKHKTKGTRRSKLEIYIEEHLSSLYPDLLIHYNKKDTINSELDIYIPSLNLAFELNGIFHYEPIFGDIKLAQIQNNDNRKMQACIEKKVELCIIDVSNLKYFKPKNAQKYLDIITSIIEMKLA